MSAKDLYSFFAKKKKSPSPTPTDKSVEIEISEEAIVEASRPTSSSPSTSVSATTSTSGTQELPETSAGTSCAMGEPRQPKGKRPHVSQTTWLRMWEWLSYENGGMLCTTCKEARPKDTGYFDGRGSTDFRTSALRRHAASKQHTQAQRTLKSREANILEKQALESLQENEAGILSACKTTYFMAKEHLPNDLHRDLMDFLRVSSPSFTVPHQRMGTMAVDTVSNNTADLRHLTPKIVVVSSPSMGMKDRENPDVLECHRVEEDQPLPNNNREEEQRLLKKKHSLPLPEGRKPCSTKQEKILFQTWKPLFDKYDVNNKGVITLEAFQVILYKHGLKDALPAHKLEKLESTIEENPGGNISYTEFVNIMSEKRSLSFSMAIRPRTNEFAVNIGSQTPIMEKVPLHQRFLTFIGDEYLAKETDRSHFLNNCSWCLPPFIVVVMCVLQFAFYIGTTVQFISQNIQNNTHNVTLGEFMLAGPVSNTSIWIYSPKDQLHFWRFATYCLVNAGVEHLLFNLSIHLLIGFPLEVIHGSRRIGGFYAASITLGAMGTSLLDRTGYLCGSSSASYAFLTAHLANSITNYQTANWNFLRLGIVYSVVLLDFGCGIYRRHGGFNPPFSYLGHIIGILVGPTLGLFILRSYNQKLHDRLGLWLVVTLYIGFVIVVVIFNIIHPVGTHPGS